MNLPTEHPHEDLAVLALDALADDERAAVEAHVQRCPACAAELDDYRATLSLVAAEPVTPPSGTWDAIVERVAAGSNGHSRAPIPGPTADTVAGSPPQGPAGPDPTSDTAPASVGAPGGSVTRLDSDPSGPTGPSRFARLRPAAFLAAAAAVVVVVGLAVGLRSDDDDRAGGDVLASAQATIDSPGASVADLATPEGRAVVIELDGVWHCLEKSPTSSGCGRLGIGLRGGSSTGNRAVVTELPRSGTSGG